MGIRVYIRAQKLVAGFYAPYSGHGEKEALVRCKPVDFGAVLPLLGHLKRVVGYGDATLVGRVLAYR